jgi:hypothetical protein
MPFAPASSGYGGSQYYANFTATGGKNVGMGFDLNRCGSNTGVYDVTAYTGISFAYKSSHDVRIEFASAATTPPPIGTCSSGALCQNHHFVTLAQAAAWTTVTVKFSSAIQDFGAIAPLDKTKVIYIQFHVMGAWNNETMSQGNISPAAVDLSVDSISFTVN